MRDLTDSELIAVSGGVSDIIVIGHRDDSNQLSFNTFGLLPNENHSAFQDQGANAQHSVVSVNVHVANNANLAGATDAAENWAKALNKIVDAASKLPYNYQLTLADGSKITAAQLIDQIAASKFVMTDTTNFGNGGAGTADRSTMTDTLDYHKFTGNDGYANPTFTNQQGMTGIVLHEIGHMTAAGFANTNGEHLQFNVWGRQTNSPHAPGDYIDSAFYNDDEAFADESARGMALGLNIDEQQFLNGRSLVLGGITWQGPNAVFAEQINNN